MIRVARLVLASVVVWELLAAVLFVSAAWLQFGVAAALTVGGVMAALKSYELDQ